MAKLDTPSIQDLYDQFIADYESRTGATKPLASISFVRAIAWAVAGMAILVYRFGRWVYFQNFIETCSEDTLRIQGEEIGVFFKNGSETEGQVTVTGVSASSIPAETVWISSEGGIYRTTSAAAVVDGVAVCPFRSSEIGVSTIIAVGETLSIGTPYDGVPSTGTVTAITVEGADAETLDAYRFRVATRKRLPANGGSFSDYFFWTTEVEGISDALPYVLSPGLVTVYPVAVGTGSDRAPTAVKLDEVRSSIRQSPGSLVYDRQPVQSSLTVRAPTFSEFTIYVEGLTPFADTALNRTAIKSTVLAYLNTRRPQVFALGYLVSGATISESAVAAEVYKVLNESVDPGSITGVTIEQDGSPIVDKTILGEGVLANLAALYINGVIVP